MISQPLLSPDLLEDNDFPSDLPDQSEYYRTVAPATTRDAVVMAIFSINCTLPPHDTTFVQPPNARGTLDIVYSCLAVIVLCTWSVLHLNVPLQVTPANRREKLLRILIRMSNKLKWMAFNVLAPEWPFAHAVSGLLSERREKAKFDRYTGYDRVPWTGSHTQLANMGGFVIRFSRTLQSSVHPDYVAEQRENTRCVVDKYCCNRLETAIPQSHQTLTDTRHPEENLQHPVGAGLSNNSIPIQVFQRLHAALRHGIGCPHAIRTHRPFGITTWKPDPINTAIARAAVANLDLQQFGNETSGKKIFLHIPQVWGENLRALCGNRWTVDASQLALVRQLGIIENLPRMAKDEIDDLNKGDIFLKVLAVSQISWLCIQLIARLCRRLPTTQLEVVTLAFAITSMITYALLYSRPKDVQTDREVRAARYPTPAEMTQIAATGPDYIGSSTLRGISIPNNATHSDTQRELGGSIMAILIVFGGLHLLAWNYEFPTQVERRLWQASAIVTLAAIPLVVLLQIFYELTRLSSKPLNAVKFVILPVIFVAARAFILVEMVRSLAFQPPETFRTTWAANVPHIG